MMGIGKAVKAMWDGKRVQRAGWNGKDMWVAIQAPDDNSKMEHPYVYISTAQGKLVPWTVSQLDLLATDWSVLDDV